MNGKAFLVGAVMLAVGLSAGYYVGWQELKEDRKLMLNESGGMSASQIEFCRGFSRLWNDHVIWTRQYIVAALANGPDAQAAGDRLMVNKQALADSLVPYYGEDVGKRFATLLIENLGITIDLIKAAKEEGKNPSEELDGTCKVHAQEVAEFLSSMNPHWQKDVLVQMFYDHLKGAIVEVDARLEGNWDADVQAFDAALTQIGMLSKALAMGIMQQFPGKF